MADGNALLKWLGNNPEAVNSGYGFLKGLQNEKSNQAQIDNEIAKTQYGYLLGQGIGDTSKANKMGAFDSAVGGYLSGTATRQQNEMNKKVMDLLSAKANKENAGAISDATGVLNDNGGTEEYKEANRVANALNPTYIEAPVYKEKASELLNTMFQNAAQPGAYKSIDASGNLSKQIEEAKKFRNSRYPASTGGY